MLRLQEQHEPAGVHMFPQMRVGVLQGKIDASLHAVLSLVGFPGWGSDRTGDRDPCGLEIQVEGLFRCRRALRDSFYSSADTLEQVRVLRATSSMGECWLDKPDIGVRLPYCPRKGNENVPEEKEILP
jgi:hypothetical protein